MKVTILRGISGCGKSTWAAKQVPVATIVSADTFFIQPDGSYKFDGTKLQAAHRECFRLYLAALEKKTEYIIVDNTNITAWEMSPYVLAAEVFGYQVEILTLQCDPEIAIERKNLVSPEKVRQLAKRLDEEAKKLPPFMQAIHRAIKND